MNFEKEIKRKTNGKVRKKRLKVIDKPPLYTKKVCNRNTTQQNEKNMALILSRKYHIIKLSLSLEEQSN